MYLNKNPKKTNMEGFLQTITPRVKLKSQQEFKLNDLWEFFNDSSPYGVCVPITLQNGEIIYHHFAPSLSAIQIFTTKSSREEEKKENNSSGDSISKLSNGNKVIFNDKTGYLYFQFTEYNTPFERYPLMERIETLAEKYPGLLSLRSGELSPTSWVSIAWYPIYAIPMGRKNSDLSTCFLSYHTISSFPGHHAGGGIGGVPRSINPKQKDGECIHLLPFGLAHFKLNGNLWFANMNAKEHEKFRMLCCAPDSWLRQLNFNHSDYNFFTRMSRR